MIKGSSATDMQRFPLVPRWCGRWLCQLSCTTWLKCEKSANFLSVSPHGSPRVLDPIVSTLQTNNSNKINVIRCERSYIIYRTKENKVKDKSQYIIHIKEIKWYHISPYRSFKRKRNNYTEAQWTTRPTVRF
jgi:hypothetical protein